MIQPTLVGILSIALQLVVGSLTIWAGILVFRQRGAMGWTILIGSILSVTSMILSHLWPFLTGYFGLASGSNEWILSFQAVYIVGGVGQLAFLGGLVLHLLRGSSEAQRIEQLEAIIRDRDQAS